MPALLALLLTATPPATQAVGLPFPNPQGPIFSQAASTASRGVAAPFFEFAPLPDAGTGVLTACACTAVTGTKGEVITWPRLSSAYCTTTGFASSGLTPGTMALCGNNLPRAESDGTAVGVLGESGGATNDNLNSEDFSALTYTSTAAVSTNTFLSPANTLTGDSLTDASAIAIQSSCQTIITTSSTKHTVFAYLSADSLAAASVRMTGAGSSTGDCVASTTTLAAAPSYSILGCTSPAAYGALLTSVVVCVEVGTVVGDTGAIVAWGLDHKVSAVQRSSYVPTGAASATRAADGPPTVTKTLTSLAGSGSCSASVTPQGTTAGAAVFLMAGSGRPMYSTASGLHIFDGTTDVLLAPAYSAGVTKRYWSSWAGVLQTITNVTDVTANTGAFDGAMATTGPLNIVADAIGGGTDGNWIVSRMCLDTDPLRCR